MFEKFTERARKAIVLAQEEVRRLGHNYTGTEHMLLGLIAEDEGIAARVLKAHGLVLANARARVENITGRGEGAQGQAPFTPRAKEVCELALREAQQLLHGYIGTEHLLLGLLRETEGVAARVLSSLGPNYADVLRRAVVEQIDVERRERKAKEEASIPQADILAHKVALAALAMRNNPAVSSYQISPAYCAAVDSFGPQNNGLDRLIDEYEELIYEKARANT